MAMKTHIIRDPEGNEYRINAPEDASSEELYEYVQTQILGREPATEEVALPEEEEEFVSPEEETLVQKAQRVGAKTAAAAVSGLGGAGQFAYEFSQGIYDWAGNTFGLDWAKNQADRIEAVQQNLGVSTERVAAEFAGHVMGEPVPVEAVKDIAAKGQKFGENLSEMFTLGAVGAKTAMAASTLPRAIAANSAEGWLWGFLGSESEAPSSAKRFNDRLGEANLSAVMSAPFSLLPGAAITAKNVVGRFTSPVIKSPAAQRMYSLADEYGVNGIITMTGDPIAQKMGADAASRQAQETLAQQGVDAVKGIARKWAVKLPPAAKLGVGFNKRIQGIFDGLNAHIGQKQQIKNDQWTQTVKTAKDISNNKPVYAPTDFNQTVQDVLYDVGSMKYADLELSKGFKRLVNDVDQSVKSGGATVDQLDQWWKAINDWKAHGGIVSPKDHRFTSTMPFQQRMAGKLSAAMKQSIDAAAQTQQGTTGGRAIGMLRSARDNYHESMKEINGLRASINDLMGNIHGSPEQLIKNLQSMDPLVARRIGNNIRQTEGGAIMLKRIQEAGLEAAALAATRTSRGLPGQAGWLDVQSFTENFSANVDRSIMAGLISKEQERYARDGIELMRNILNGQINAPRAVVRRNTLGAELSDIAINAVSRSKEFMARLAARALTKGKGADWLFYSKEGNDLLRSLQPKNVKDLGRWAAARNAGITAMMEFIKVGSMEDLADQVSVTLQEAEQ